MKKLMAVMVAVFCFAGMISGCGGGGERSVSPIIVSVSPEPIDPNEIEIPIEVFPVSQNTVSYMYSTGDGSISDDSYVSYQYQLISAGSKVMVGAKVSGSCGNGSWSCEHTGVPVTFRAYDGSTQIGAIVTGTTDGLSIATAEIDLSSIVVPAGSVKNIRIQATVESEDWISPEAYSTPSTSMEVDMVPVDFIASYSAKVDQDVAVSIVSGGGSYSGYGSVRVKNTGNAPWYNFTNRTDRVYMVTQSATGSIFFNSSSWYDQTVVSDVYDYDDVVRPGDTVSMSFSLSATNVTPGEYRECFKLQKPGSIASGWDYYTLVDPIEIEGSEFCVNITVLPATLRITGDGLKEELVELFGKLYWESQLEKD